MERLMTNSLVIADLHVDDYKLYNPSPHYRLHQPMLLADRLLRLSDQLNADKLFILGDLLNKPIVEPKILHELKNFLTRVTSKFEVYYITGQHDNSSKAVELAYVDSLVNALEDISPRLHYYHNKFLKIENCNIYMRNWTNVTDYPIPDEPIDIYLSHLSLGFGQTIDSSKFKLGIFGDIHEPVQYGNCYSVGTPYQHYPSQPEQGYIGVITIDGSNCSFKRLNSDDEYVRFLRLKETEQYKNNLFTDSGDQSFSESTVRVDMTKNIFNQVEELIKLNGLEDIHSKIPKNNLPTPIDFNFKLLSLKVDNFKSIEHLELDFRKLGKVLFLSGKNGSGKSATIESIIVGLLGDRQIRKYNRVDKDGNIYDCSIDIELSYNNTIYKIQRGPGYTVFWEDYANNEEPVSKNNKSQLESYIYESLPFLNYLYFFIVRANSHFFNNLDRTELIKVCFNIFVFDYLIQEGNELKKSTYEELSKLESLISYVRASIDSSKEKVSSSEAELSKLVVPSMTTDEIKVRREAIINSKNNLELLWSSKTQFESELSSLNSWTTFDESKVDEANKSIDGFDKLNKFNTDHNNWALNLDRSNNIISDYEYRIKSKESDIVKVSNNFIECPNCKSKIGLDTELIENIKLELDKLRNDLETAKRANLQYISEEPKIESYDIYKSEVFKTRSEAVTYLTQVSAKSKALSRINDVKSEIDRLTNEYSLKYQQFMQLLNGKKSSDYLLELNEMDSQWTSIKIAKENLEVYKRDLADKLSELNSLESKIPVLANQLDRINKYISLFNINDLNSITYNIIKQVTTILNSDNIKFETTRELASGDLRFSVSVSINIQGAWRDYDSASDGQKCIMDMYIINKISSLLGNIGLLIMDESLANIDSSNYEVASEFLKSTPAKNIIVTSHSTEFTGEDNRISYELIDGVSNVLIS